MNPSDDPQLDALLQRAAPDGAPPGLADRILSTGHVRLRRRRLVRLAAAAIALLALAAGAILGLDALREPSKKPLAKAAESHIPISDQQSAISNHVLEAPSASFAAVLPSRGDATHSVMVGYLDGRLAAYSRPIALAPSGARVMLAWSSPD